MSEQRQITPFLIYEFVKGSDYGEEAFEVAVRSAWRGLHDRSPDLEFDCLKWLETWALGVRDAKSAGPL